MDKDSLEVDLTKVLDLFDKHIRYLTNTIYFLLPIAAWQVGNWVTKIGKWIWELWHAGA